MSANSSGKIMNQVTDAVVADTDEQRLYSIGGAASLLCALMYLITMVIYIPANRAGPPPGTVVEWFTLLQTNPITGLFFLGLADIVIMILWGPMSLALYAALKQSNRTWSLFPKYFFFFGLG